MNVVDIKGKSSYVRFVLDDVISKPYITTMDEDFIVFVVAGKSPVEEDDDSDYPDSEEDI